MGNKILVYDALLRDGSQGVGVSFSLDDKLRIAWELDRLGIDYIEGGQPGSNPKDIAFFQRASEYPWTHAKIAAFGPTRKKDTHPKDDPSIKTLLASGAPVVTIYGKSDVFHVDEALETSLDENLRMIWETIAYLRDNGAKEVVYDAEHFFDGFKSDQGYSMKTLQKAVDAGADFLVLCDTNGGNDPFTIADAVRAVRAEFPRARLGIHAHNDSDSATDNSYAAVREGAEMVQGTINGLGERVGNADLVVIIPKLYHKGYAGAGNFDLSKLVYLSRFVNEVANLVANPKQPYVGEDAFAHKGGGHVAAVLKNPQLYEHIDPASVGNQRRFVVSDLSGTGNMQAAYDIDRKDPLAAKLLAEIKRREHQGYVFESAEGSLELLRLQIQGVKTGIFELVDYEVSVHKRGDEEPSSRAVVRIKVGDRIIPEVEYGDGPVNALDKALRAALTQVYPELTSLNLQDYKVRIVPDHLGTASRVRVHIDSSNSHGKFGTVGVHPNIIEASWHALVESLVYEHHRINRAN